MAAQRARQINSYHHQLGEGIGLEEAPPPLVESRSKNYLTMAMEEIAKAKLRFAYASREEPCAGAGGWGSGREGEPESPSMSVSAGRHGTMSPWRASPWV